MFLNISSFYLIQNQRECCYRDFLKSRFVQVMRHLVREQPLQVKSTLCRHFLTSFNTVSPGYSYFTLILPFFVTDTPLIFFTHVNLTEYLPPLPPPLFPLTHGEQVSSNLEKVKESKEGLRFVKVSQHCRISLVESQVIQGNTKS